MFDYIDPLYGKLPLTDAEVKLFQTPELARLRDISLSAVPSVMLSWGKIASRFEHSVGVAHLAKIVAEKPEFAYIGLDLIFAGLLHDVGSPPFSHLTEIFLETKLGVSHELFAEEMLESGDVFTIIQNAGGHPQTILKLIAGSEPTFGPIIAGTIDLDNLDNTLRFGMGAGLIKRLYEPENLARSFGFNPALRGKTGSSLTLNSTTSRDLDGWEFCRQQVYAAVYSDTNLAAATMLVRAIELAFTAGDINEDFFFQTDHQALYILEHNCNPLTRALTTDARLWHHYQKAYEIITTTPSASLKKLCSDKTNWGKLADTLARDLNVPPAEITVHTDKDKGYKMIDLPIVGSTVTVQHQPRYPLRYLFQIYLHPRHAHLHDQVIKIAQDLIAE